jgi:hypothetical protein
MAYRQQEEIDITSLPDTSDRCNKGIDIRYLKDLRSKGLSYSQIGKVAGCSKTNVLMRLEGFENEHQDIKAFKEGEADILTGLRLKIVKSISDADLKKASLQVKTMAYGILYDKYRLETSQSTDNVSVIVQAIQAARGLNE